MSNTKNMRWPRERIRQEIRQLDHRTGLNGTRLAIDFSEDEKTIGSFTHTAGNIPLHFTFSTRFFERPSFSDAEVIDVIRHEFAHYMKCVRHPDVEEDSHGPLWQQCCREIGAVPQARHSYSTQYRAERLQQHMLLSDADEIVQPGLTINHPRYGECTISHISHCRDMPRVSLTLPNGRVRKCTMQWLIDNCL